MTDPIHHLQLFAEEGEAAAPSEEGRKAALYDAFAPSLETLAKKYGIEADPAALEEALHREARAEQEHRQAQADSLYSSWMDQARKTKADYPGFDLEQELRDPRFRGLLRSRVDIRTAYEALHRQEALDRMEQQLVGRLAQTGPRPRENGTASQAPAVTRQDVARMSRADRQAIIQRVQRGERISF